MTPKRKPRKPVTVRAWCFVYERGREDVLALIRKDCSVDDNGDPVGARPTSDWEAGLCAGIRMVYRILKRAAPLASEAKP